MADIVIKPEDLENMPEETREIFLNWYRDTLGLGADLKQEEDSNKAKLRSSLSPDLPNIISVEAAIATIAPLKAQGLMVIQHMCHHRVAKALLRKRLKKGEYKPLYQPTLRADGLSYKPSLKDDGLSIYEIAKLLKTSEKSINGIIGSINRRFAFRFNKTKHDRKKCRVIYYDRKLGTYKFITDQIRLSFAYARDALFQIATEGMSYEQYNYEECFFKTGQSTEEGIPLIIRPNPDAIDSFMREDSEVHCFSESWDVNDTTTPVNGNMMIQKQICHVPVHQERAINSQWYKCYLRTAGLSEDKWTLVSEESDYEQLTTSKALSEENSL